MAKKTGNNRLNVEWSYAKLCWTALKNEQPVPPIPEYDIWETEEQTGKRKYVSTKPISPMQVTCKGKTVFRHG